MSPRHLFLVWLAAGLFCFSTAVRAEEPKATSAKGRGIAPPDADSRPSQRLVPVWRALLLVCRQIEVDYTFESGKRLHFSNKLADQEVQAAVWSFRQYPSLAYKHSNGEVVIQYDIVYPNRVINSVTKMGKDVWWLSPNDTRPEIDKYAPKGTYDSILVLAPLSDHASGKSVPTGGWGLAIGPSDWSNGASYCTVGNAPVSGWNEPTPGEVWLHEWLHGACAHFAKKGFAMPKGDADAGGSHGYKHSPVEGWGQFYRDLMTGQVLDEGRRTGVTKEAWRSGAIFGKVQRVIADYFCSDTISCYDTTGKVRWTGRGGKHENISLGDTEQNEIALRLTAELKKKCLVTARFQIPASGVGQDDSVGIVLGDGKTERYGSLEFGTRLDGKTKVSIRLGRLQEKSAPLSLVPGWYTVKFWVDPAAKTMSMKTWLDGENEPPSWQVSAKLPSRWSATKVGFKHIGRGTLVDDLVVVEQP
jgi:hypothetical protein